jgi:serine/threonine protein kinase
MGRLLKGDKVPLENSGEVEVIEEIGSGGQGIVYKVRFASKEYALKWYTNPKIKSSDDFYNNIRLNINDGPPKNKDGQPSNDFLWPKFLTRRHQGSYGYIMELRPKEYSKFSAILNVEVKFRSLHSMVLFAMNITNNFRDLHREGKSYQDLNDGNFFVDVDTGNVLICDNDNVVPDQMNLGIGGTPGYMAPEIVRGEARPDTLTDRHSLAVVLFKLFMRHDPLMGRKFVESVVITEEAEKRLYGDSPLLIFDPEDTSNAPVPGIHPNPIKLWSLFPDYIQEAFIQSFCKGMKEPAMRLPANEWQKILIRLRGEMLTCSCGSTFFASMVKNKVRQGVFECHSCKTKCSYPLMLEIKTHPVYLFPKNKLYLCHTDRDSDDYKTETGEVVQNKNDRELWGIKNLSGTQWQCSFSGHPPKTVPKEGGIVPLREGARIEFKQITGTITKEQLQ